MARNSNLTGGIVLIAVGAVLLLDTLGIADMWEVMRFWPVILILLGVRLVLGDRRPRSDSPDDIPPSPPAVS